jgi:hypothetical protein
MEGNYFARYRSTPQPTLTVREKEAGITQSGASAASSAASAEQTRAKMRLDALANKRRRATPEEVKAAGLEKTGLSYQINGLGDLTLYPGQTKPKAKPAYDPEKIKDLQSAIDQVKNAERLAKEGFLTVGRPAEIITGLPFIGGLLDQDRVDFLAANEAVNSAIMRSIIEQSQQNAPAGVTGMFNTPMEQQIAAAAKVQLNPTQSKSQYLGQTPRAKRFFEGLVASELAKLNDKYSGAPTSPSAPQGDSDLVARVMAEKARRVRERALKGQK